MKIRKPFSKLVFIPFTCSIGSRRVLSSKLRIGACKTGFRYRIKHKIESIAKKKKSFWKRFFIKLACSFVEGWLLISLDAFFAANID